jgi:hypothetical protein
MKKKKKRMKKKKKQIKKIGKVLGLSYLELKSCKQNTITTTCRKVTKTMYPTRDLLAKQHISSMLSNQIRAIHCKYTFLENHIYIR